MTEPDKSTLLSPPDSAEAQPKRFSHEEMVTCEACLRANPPTRTNCLYCAAPLPASAVSQTNGTDEGRKPAAAANGRYIVITPRPGEQISAASLDRVAERLQVSLPDLQNAISAGRGLPVRRTEAIEESSKLIDELQVLGFDTVSIEEDELSSLALPKTIRALEFSEGGVVGSTRASGEQMFAAWDDLILIVLGRLHANHVELVGRRKRGGTKLRDRRVLSGDESVFDLYSKSGQSGWRITASNFDFSSLGAEKGIIAFENFRALIKVLRERAKNLEVDDSYLQKRSMLGNVWPLGEDTRRGGWRRSGAGKYDVSTLTTTDNENQFSNYSRLVYCLKLRELERQKPDR
ncbi:MAG: hypothetical protein ACXW18_08585 [Pyrinomonadaceae bacterium]